MNIESEKERLIYEEDFYIDAKILGEDSFHLLESKTIETVAGLQMQLQEIWQIRDTKKQCYQFSTEVKGVNGSEITRFGIQLVFMCLGKLESEWSIWSNGLPVANCKKDVEIEENVATTKANSYGMATQRCQYNQTYTQCKSLQFEGYC